MNFPSNAPAKIRILVTGFGAFPGARVNPTQQIVSRLARSRRATLLGVEFVPAILPVVYKGAEARLSQVVQRATPDAVLHLGLAGRRRELSVETRAINRLSTLRPDAARSLPASPMVRAGEPHRAMSRWSSPRLLAAIRKTGARAHLSIDAGDYLCNQALYLTLANTNAPAGFIHVPRPRGHRVTGKPRPTLQTMTRAIEAAGLELARAARVAKGLS
jgi:pyroglutamyl-peptidase